MKKITSSLALILLLAAMFTQSTTTVQGAPHSVILGAVNITFRSAGAFDGWILESTETSVKGGSMDSAATTMRLGDDAQDRQYRAILSFDTSTLPANAVIKSVTLKIKMQSTSGADPFTTHGNLTVDIRRGMFSNNSALQLGDFAVTASKVNAMNFSKTPASGWYTARLGSANFGYVSRTGITQFRLRFTKDDNDDRGADMLKIYSGNAGAVVRPQLIVVYTLDTTAPATVNTLSAVKGPDAGTVTLSWTAPGDDGDTGAATSYEVRHASNAIVDEASWSAALPVTGVIPTPQAAGGSETMTVTGLTPGARYYFAVRALDEIPNRGAVSANSPSAVAFIPCGQVVTKNTILGEDMICPPEVEYAIVIGASNIILDLGGHTVSGYTPGIGVLATGREGIAIRNGTIEGFEYGIFIIESDLVTMENLTVKNLDISDPGHLILGISILASQNVVVRDSLFEFVVVAHKEAVEIYESYVDVSNIEVRGGGAGVNFSFTGNCDPVNRPSNGTVRNSRFYNIEIAGIEVACTSYAWIEDNVFTAAPTVGIGIQGDAPFAGAVTGLTVKGNIIHDTMIGIEFRGIVDSSVSNNHVFDNPIWGIAIRQSLGCLVPESGWECFYSTGNSIADNETWGNGMDLYHYEYALGNTWANNTCETKEGAEIPDCIPPTAPLTINHRSSEAFSFFTFVSDFFRE